VLQPRHALGLTDRQLEGGTGGGARERRARGGEAVARARQPLRGNVERKLRKPKEERAESSANTIETELPLFIRMSNRNNYHH